LNEVEGPKKAPDGIEHKKDGDSPNETESKLREEPVEYDEASPMSGFLVEPIPIGGRVPNPIRLPLQDTFHLGVILRTPINDRPRRELTVEYGDDVFQI